MKVLPAFVFGLMTLLLGHSSLSAPPTFKTLDKKYSVFSQHKSPGFALLILKDGKPLHQAAFGLADRTQNHKNSKATNFNIASNSKQFTAGLALLLMQDGLLKEEDSITKYLPEMKGDKSKITVGHLIGHLSGVDDYMELCEKKTKVLNQDIVDNVAQKKLLFTPGSKWEYSNSGYVVLSEILARVGKKPFADLMQERIFSPLRMTGTILRDEKNESLITERAFGYDAWPWFKENDAGPCNYNYGDGGVYISLNDYPKWLQSLTTDVLFKESSRKKMFSSFKTSSGEETGYGYGWGLDPWQGHPAVGHNGGWQGFRSKVVFLPELNIWSILLSNYSGISVREITNEYLEVAVQKPSAESRR